MNNNNFALLRYLRDLGADVDLLLMADDGIGSLAHFRPENDTWHFERWAPHILQLEVSNRFISAIGRDFPWRVLFLTKHLMAVARTRANSTLTRIPSRVRLASDLSPYDRLVGSGITPALVQLANRQLDVFYPYSSGVEWVDDPDMRAILENGSLLKRHSAKRVRIKQIAGIRAAHTVLSSDVGYTAEVFANIGVKPQLVQLPMLYREIAPTLLPAELTEVLQRIAPYELRFVSHVRHRWVNTGDHDDVTWEAKYSKHNNWIIGAYKAFRLKYPSVRSVLVLVEYGTDVAHTKRLCQELGVAQDIIWIPSMSRIHLMEILAACDIGIGEFYSVPRMIWGGAALEVMACGKPLIQGFNFGDGVYSALYGHPQPPLCPVRSQEDLTKWVVRLGESPLLREQLGRNVLKWFETYSGQGLARTWLEKIVASKTITY